MDKEKLDSETSNKDGILAEYVYSRLSNYTSFLNKDRSITLYMSVTSPVGYHSVGELHIDKNLDMSLVIAKEEMLMREDFGIKDELDERGMKLIFDDDEQ